MPGRTATRCCCPPESSRGEALLVAVEADEAQALLRLLALLGLGEAGEAIGDVLQHRHVRKERVGLEDHADVALRGRQQRHILPPIRIGPPLATSSPAIILSVVVLPHPEGPSSVTRLPASITKDTCVDGHRPRHSAW